MSVDHVLGEVGKLSLSWPCSLPPLLRRPTSAVAAVWSMPGHGADTGGEGSRHTEEGVLLGPFDHLDFLGSRRVPPGRVRCRYGTHEFRTALKRFWTTIQHLRRGKQCFILSQSHRCAFWWKSSPWGLRDRLSYRQGWSYRGGQKTSWWQSTGVDDSATLRGHQGQCCWIGRLGWWYLFLRSRATERSYSSALPVRSIQSDVSSDSGHVEAEETISLGWPGNALGSPKKSCTK